MLAATHFDFTYFQMQLKISNATEENAHQEGILKAFVRGFIYVFILLFSQTTPAFFSYVYQLEKN